MRKEKQLLLNESKDRLKGVSTLILASYRSMDPNVTFALRMSLIRAGGCLQIVKKRMFLKAASELDIPVDVRILKGHIGVVHMGDDIVATTKALYQFMENNRNLIEVVGGLYEGRKCFPENFKEIALLPDREQICALFLGVLDTPMLGILRVIEALQVGVISCIDQKIQKEE